MSRSSDWENAYLVQARSDWAVYGFLSNTTLPDCHGLHYLQMTMEKLAKALLIRGGRRVAGLRRGHMAFAKFLRAASKDANLAEAHGMSKAQFRSYCASVGPLAYHVERLNPQPAGAGPNVEYPREAGDGMVRIPAEEDLPEAQALKTPRGVKLLKTLRLLLTKYESINQ